MNYGFIPEGDLPPEIQAQIDKARMEAEDSDNARDRFLNELTKEQLVQLGKLLNSIVGSDKRASAIAAFYQGIVFGITRERHGICANCGLDHKEEDLHRAGIDLTVPVTPTVPDVPEAPFSDTSLGRKLEGLLENTERTLMEKYRLEYIVGENQASIPRVKCRDCGVVYPSLEDRMVKEPDDCDGCHQKAKFG